MASKKTPDDLKLLAQVADLTYKQYSLAEIAVELRRDIKVVAMLQKTAIEQNVDRRKAYSREYLLDVALGGIEQSIVRLNRQLDCLGDDPSLIKIGIEREMRMQRAEWCKLNGLGESVTAEDELPLLLEIGVRQVEDI